MNSIKFRFATFINSNKTLQTVKLVRETIKLLLYKFSQVVEQKFVFYIDKSTIRHYNRIAYVSFTLYTPYIIVT